MSKSEASKVILEFLTQENRPYAINDIMDKCGKPFGKSMVQKTLDALVKDCRISEKTYGKHNIYFATQTKNIIELKKELQSLNQKLSQVQGILKNKQAEYRELETELKNTEKVRSVESLENERDQLMDDIREANEKLRRHEIMAAESQITPEEAKQIEKMYANLASAYRKRKRICNDMLEAIMEGYPKPKRQLVEDIGVETDESVGFKVDLKQ